jgi:hypothetical protein
MATSTGSRLATAFLSSRMIRGAGTSATKPAVPYAWNPGSRSRLRRLLSVPEPEAAGPLPWDAGMRQRGRDRATLTPPGDRGDLRGARDRIRPAAVVMTAAIGRVLGYKGIASSDASGTIARATPRSSCSSSAAAWLPLIRRYARCG